MITNENQELEEWFFICKQTEIPQKGIFSVIAVRKDLAATFGLDKIADYLNSEKCEGAHLFFIPTPFYMREYLDLDENYYVCLYVQYWG